VSRHRLPNRGNKADETAGTAEEAKETASGAAELTEPTVAETEPAVVDEPAEEAAQASSADETEPAGEPEPVTAKRGVNWSRVFAFGVLPAVALLLTLGAGYLKWQDNSVRNSDTAAIESVQVAKDSTVAMLSYKPDTVEQQLNAARKLLTGEFEESYSGLINDVVIPGAKQKQISAVASAPAAASVSAEPNKAVVLVFVNQTVAVGQDPPTDTASSVRVTLEKIDGHWLISKFDPV
jgi:Mce-associated membrane protein